MKTTTNLLILLSLIFFSNNEVFSEDAYVLDININLDKSMPIHKDIFGVNGNLVRNRKGYDDAGFIKLFKELGSPYTRFPGGTAANLYDWKTATFKKNPEGPKKHNARVTSYNRGMKRLNRHYDTKSFLSCIKQSKSSFAIVLNIANETPDNTKEWMEHIKSLGHTVSKVERGNELYFPGYKNFYPDPMEYVKASKEHSIAIKKVFPDCKVGLLISSIPYSNENFIVQVIAV